MVPGRLGDGDGETYYGPIAFNPTQPLIAITPGWSKWYAIVNSHTVERILAQLAEAYLQMGRYREALAAAEKMIVIDPNSAPGYARKAEALFGLGDFESAVQADSRAIELHPTNPWRFRHRGNSYVQLGKWRQALDDFQNYNSMRPGDGPGLAYQALLQLRLGDSAAYQVRCASVIDQYFDNPQPPLGNWMVAISGYGSLKTETRNKAIEIGSGLLANAKPDDDLIRDLGILYYRDQEFERAARQFEQAMGIDDQSFGNRLWFAMASFRLGKKTQAQEWFRKAIEALNTHASGYPLSLAQLEILLIREEADQLFRQHQDKVTPTLDVENDEPGHANAADWQLEPFIPGNRT